jgi:hypothetical protein
MVRPKQAAIKVSHLEAPGMYRGGVAPSGRWKMPVIEYSENSAELPLSGKTLTSSFSFLRKEAGSVFLEIGREEHVCLALLFFFSY